MEMIQSVKNDSVHLNQIETIKDDFQIWRNVFIRIKWWNADFKRIQYRPVIQIHLQKTIGIDTHLNGGSIKF